MKVTATINGVETEIELVPAKLMTQEGNQPAAFPPGGYLVHLPTEAPPSGSVTYHYRTGSLAIVAASHKQAIDIARDWGISPHKLCNDAVYIIHPGMSIRGFRFATVLLTAEYQCAIASSDRIMRWHQESVLTRLTPDGRVIYL